MGRPCVTEYEQQREARLSENRKRMEALGLLDLSRSINSAKESLACGHAIGNLPRKRQKREHSLLPPLPPPPSNIPSRRSSRLQGTTAPCYKEISTTSKNDSSEEVVDSRIREPEIYTAEDEKLLGPCEQDWELFKDGFGPDGNRIYDSVLGKTCHQCRQKTLGLRTACSKCQKLRGQFCGDCLFMRYGENVVEALKNNDWVCPGCRGICNCSFCRLKKGWAPTGSMYRLAQQMNFKSVAHYLIMTRRGSQPAEVAGSKRNPKENNTEQSFYTEDEEKSKTNFLVYAPSLQSEVLEEGEQKIESEVLVCEDEQKKIGTKMLLDEDEMNKMGIHVLPFIDEEKNEKVVLVEEDGQVFVDEAEEVNVETEVLPDADEKEIKMVMLVEDGKLLVDEGEEKKIETQVLPDEGEKVIGKVVLVVEDDEVLVDQDGQKIEVDKVNEHIIEPKGVLAAGMKMKNKLTQIGITNIYKQVKVSNSMMLHSAVTMKVHEMNKKPDDVIMQRKKKHEDKGEVKDVVKRIRIMRSMSKSSA